MSSAASNGASGADRVHLWRIVLPHRAGDALSGEGARRFGGRWNRPGQAAVYTASSPSLALLEWVVNVDPSDAPAELVAIAFELPDDEPVTRYRADTLPRGWRSYPVLETVRGVGAAWLDAGQTVALVIPSAVLPLTDETNVVLNPEHAAMHRVTEARRETISLDPRLFR